MDKVSLKIVIAGRTYPLTIKGEEEMAIREAADRINTNIQKLQGTYAVKDMQDLLAMTALQMAVQLKNTAEATPSVQPQFDEDIQKIIYKIDAQL
ncbi:MAG: cell division protein ZapA [Bacteroidetes bacterium]|nr:cell division protein ZapA [Bacteroidota bacterium]